MQTTDTTPVIDPGFDPKPYIIQLKTRDKGSKDYLPVQWRLVWFRSKYPNGIIKTKPILIDLNMDTEAESFKWNEEKRRSEKVIIRAKGFASFHAHIETGEGGIGEGSKSEKAASFADFIEKAETGAIGRALAALGFGTQAAGDDLEEGYRLVDAPVHQAQPTHTNGNGTQSEQEQPKIAPPEAIKAIQGEYIRLYPKATNKPEWWHARLQAVFGEIPDPLEVSHIGQLQTDITNLKAQAAEKQKQVALGKQGATA